MATKKTNTKVEETPKVIEPKQSVETNETSKKEVKTKKETKPKTEKTAKVKNTKKEVEKTSKTEKVTKAKKEVKVKEIKPTKEATKVVEVLSTMPKEGSLAFMIMNSANNKYPYRTEKGITIIDAKTRKKLSDEEYNNLARHRDICKELVRLSIEHHNFPYTPLVYFAVGCDAHKKPIFEKGYKSINIEKAETILRWLEWFADYNNNPKFFACDKIVHAFTKFYTEYSKKDKDFKALMKKWVKMPMIDGFKTSQWKTMQEFYQILTKPLFIITEVDKETKEEKVVDVTPNPLHKANKKQKKETKAS